MSNLQDWKDKLSVIYEKVANKQVLTTVALATLVGSACYYFRRNRLDKTPAMKYLHQIQDNLSKVLQNNESLSSLVIEKEHTMEKKGICMIFNLISKLNEKQKGTKEAIRNPFLPPFEEGLFVQDLGSKHRLLLNKYNIYQGHLLVTTKQFQPQQGPLQRDDIKQTVYAFKANRGLYFFNSGPKAGASQKHRHVQIFPNEARQLPIFRSMLQYVRSKKSNVQDLKIIEYPPFNFVHGLIIIGSVGMYSESENVEPADQHLSRMQGKLSVLKERSCKAYEKLHKQFIGEDEIEYNLVGCEEFLLLVPRSKEKAFGQLGVNGVGFMGSVLFKNKELFQKFIKQERHGYQILEEVTYPKKHNS